MFVLACLSHFADMWRDLRVVGIAGCKLNSWDSCIVFRGGVYFLAFCVYFEAILIFEVVRDNLLWSVSGFMLEFVGFYFSEIRSKSMFNLSFIS